MPHSSFQSWTRDLSGKIQGEIFLPPCTIVWYTLLSNNIKWRSLREIARSLTQCGFSLYRFTSSTQFPGSTVLFASWAKGASPLQGWQCVPNSYMHCSNFSDIFDVDHFIKSVQGDVPIIKKLPEFLHDETEIITEFRSWSDVKYYEEDIASLWSRYKVCHRLPRSTSLLYISWMTCLFFNWY